MTHKDIVERGRRVLRMETEALGEAERRIGDDFARAVETIARSDGRVIVSGVGKSGLIGRKIAATFTSTGTPATFLHPADSVHGDLGIVGESDVAILISKSGESAEVLGLLDHLKRLGVCTIALTSNDKSSLARHSDVTLDAWVKEEACPHDLAPTTSTTVALALGDALAIALLEEKGFDADDFARLRLRRRCDSTQYDHSRQCSHGMPQVPHDFFARNARTAVGPPTYCSSRSLAVLSLCVIARWSSSPTVVV